MMRLLLFLFLLSFLSCDRPECKNTNPIIAQHPFHAIEYKSELARLIKEKGAENLKYWLAYYYRQDGKDYATVYVKGEDVCAIMLMDITNGEGWKHFKEAQGASYNGARLIDLHYCIEQRGLQTDFVFEKMRMILD
ncbi:MAG: hypothetical protein K0R82_1083 [Flavipsychrobacter sp.]|nr:hypothetical protein [Flavipsychrobacter sp.]